jgi:RimJ/RimL family protein N-acetyltransferase
MTHHPTLTGRNVRLRPLTVEDAERTNGWRNSPRAFLLNRGARTIDEQRAWIAARPDDEYNFIMELTATNEPVGMLSLIDIHPVHLHAEQAHFLIGEPDLVRPYGPGKIAAEAQRLLYRFAFDELGLRSHWGPVAEDNPQMVLWNKYFGSREIGRLTNHFFLDGHWQDAILMQMTVEDYRTVTVPKLRAFLGFD